MISYFRILIFVCTFLKLVINEAAAQSGVWTWMNGDTAWFNAASVHGAPGQFDPSFHPKGNYERCSWKDNQGNLWYLCDGDSLWKYDISINQWAWMKGSGNLANHGIKGVPSPANTPGRRGYGTPAWTDPDGNFWLFAGLNVGQCADLWKYNPQTNQWTWMSGSNSFSDPGVYGIQGVPSPLNYPSSRAETTASWVDTAYNTLWLFGGSVFNSYAHDLWQYNITSNEWTWMKGDTVNGTLPVYGQKGISDPVNTPGSRWSYGRWSDDNGDFWLFGGFKLFPFQRYNDTWKFSRSTNSWIWMHGRSNTTDGFAIGNCLEDTSNIPQETAENKLCWKDNCGNVWTLGEKNQVWKYNLVTNMWNLTQGIHTLTIPKRYGIMGVPDPLNHPFFSPGSEGWTDDNGNFWFLELNNSALWKFEPNIYCGGCGSQSASLFSADSTFICPGGCISFNNLSYNATSYTWSFPGATPSSSTDAEPGNICYTNPGVYDVQLIASNANSTDTLLMQGFITVSLPSPQGIIQSGDSLFANAGAANYQWYYNGNVIPGATNYFYVAALNGDYNVIATDSNGCEAEAAIMNVVTSIAAVTALLEEILVYPDPAGDILFVKWNLPFNGLYSYSVLSLTGQNMVSGSGSDPVQLAHNGIKINNLSSGMYFLVVFSNGFPARIKFVKK